MVCPKSTFLQMSQTLEDAIIANSKPSLLFVGFQKSVDWYETTPRFRELVQSATQLCLFTADKAPSSQSDKELYIELEQSSPLLQSWFLLVISSSFSALLCSQTPPDSNLANLNHAIEV
ncbi:MAG TPA: DICT sensory domain-containing protein, partial [Aggregatilineales bacterium]|nr:DICT sensory domain-containing protein [Aggregatilineales bacterium]